MTNEQVFHELAMRYGCGGRLAREQMAGAPALEIYNHVEEQARELIASARQILPNLPPIHFDFAWNGAVNAFAFREGDQYFIGITTGAIVLLNVVLNRILADAQLLQHIGDANGEASDLPPLAGLIPEAERMHQAGTLKPISPRTKSRLAYASHLFRQAILFLIGHEIAHITRGHVDYLYSKTASAVLPEIGWNLMSSIGLIERQTLEVDADTRSLNSRLHSAELTVSSTNPQVASWSSSPLSLRDTLFDCLFSINVLFRIFGDKRFNKIDLATASYPPLPLRRTILMIYAYAYSQGAWGPELKATAIATIRYALFGVDAIFATITGDPISYEGLKDASRDESKEHVKQLQDYWLGGLQERLAPFAYESDQPPPGFMSSDPDLGS